jgi:chromosome segregation ATPase
LIDERVSALETRMAAMEKRFDKVDNNLTRIWERIDQHREGQVRTQTLVEVVDKNVSELKVQIAKNTDTQNEILQRLNDQKHAETSRWEKLWERGFWAVVGSIATIAGTIILAKYVKF